MGDFVAYSPLREVSELDILIPMLTSQDLQAIGALVGSILDKKLEEKLEQKLEEKIEKLEGKLDAKFDEKLDPIKEDIKSIKNDIKYMKGTLRSVIALHGETLNSHENRITVLEEENFRQAKG